MPYHLSQVHTDNLKKVFEEVILGASELSPQRNKSGYKELKKLNELFDNNEFASKPYQSKKVFRKKFTNANSDIFDFLALINSWPEIVGQRLSAHTIPLKLNTKSLTILTDHPVYAQQLSFMEKILIDKIIAKFPILQSEVKRIYFKADNDYFQKKVSTKIVKEKKKETSEKKWHPQSPEYKLAVKEADELLKDIADDEIKEKLKSIFLQLK